MKQFDAVIIGGGPAGCAAALALLKEASLNVALIHRPTNNGRYRIGESATPSVSMLLQKLGVPHQLDKMGHAPCYGSRSQWGSSDVEEQDFITQGQGHGWHLNRAEFDAWLLQQAQLRGVTIYHYCDFIKVGRIRERYWGAEIQNERGLQRLVTRALIDASGRSSKLARQLGAKRHKVDQLTAVAYLTSPKEADNLAHLSLVESHPKGWWYSAGLPDGRAIVCFMSDADLIRKYKLNQFEVFKQLYEESDQTAANVLPPRAQSQLIHYPAHSSYIDKVAGNGWVAIGDAAISMDPLTSSGINSALADSIAAAKAIVNFLQGDDRPLREHAHNIDQTLRRYLMERVAFYRQEKRWAKQPFWSRRSQMIRIGCEIKSQ